MKNNKGTYSYSNRHRMHDLKQKGGDFCCKNSTKKYEQQGTNHDEVANLKGIIEELKKDKERLDWLFKNNATYWVYTREDLDKRMNQQTQ